MPNKAQFIEQLAERLDGDKKRAQQALDAVIQTVYANIVNGERVALTGFGIFEKRERGPRMARNPATGEAVAVGQTSVPAFRAGAEFKAVTSGAKQLAPPVKKAAAKTVPAKRVAAKASGRAAAKAPAKRAR
ncbi:MAG: HU family DNA-binding protein [Actinomycetia bacterium]|nr:HU family DNA-binding protein [Actinomycetes bacterium]